VFYEVGIAEQKVYILAIGVKEGDRLFKWRRDNQRAMMTFLRSIQGAMAEMIGKRVITVPAF